MSNIDLERHVNFTRGHYQTYVTVTRWAKDDGEKAVNGRGIRIQNSYDLLTKTSLDRLQKILCLNRSIFRPENIRLTAMVFKGHISLNAHVEGPLG